MKTIFYVEWTEIEFEYGSRPDGYSFHLTPEAAEEYKEVHYSESEYYRWEGGDVEFYQVREAIYDILAKKIKSSDKGLGIKSTRWNLYNAIRELIEEEV